MSQTLDPVTADHVRQAAAGLADEFTGIYSKETIERYVAESAGSLGDSRINVFVPVLAYRFARERLKATAKAEGLLVTDQPEVLFVCVHNAGRSQMAAGLVKLRSGGRIHVRSAGSAPGDEINPAGVEAMAEVGVDLSDEFPKPLTDEFVRAADVVITMGCGDACPIFPGKRYEDWVLDDPAGQDLRDGATDPRRDRHSRPERWSESYLPKDSVVGRRVARGGARVPSHWSSPAAGRSSPTKARGGTLGARRDRCILRPRHHGDDLRDRPPVGRTHQPGRHDRFRCSLDTSRSARAAADPPAQLAGAVLGASALCEPSGRSEPAQLGRPCRPSGS